MNAAVQAITPKSAKPTEPAVAAPPAAPQAAAAGTGDPAPRAQAPLPRGSLNFLEQHNNTWRVVAPPGSVPSDFDGTDAPWSLVAADLTFLDRVYIVGDHWWAEALVTDSAPPGFAITRILQAINLAPRRTDMDDAIPSGFKIAQATPADGQTGWLVWRLKDDVCLSKWTQLDTREAARRWLLDHATVRADSGPTVWRGQ